MATYTIQALENYTPALAASFANNTQPLWCFCDKQYIGTSYDALGRNLMYLCLIALEPYDHTSLLKVNDTGKTLWDGLASVPPGNLLDLSVRYVLNICRKNIDTGVVTFNSVYSPSNVVPSGFGAGGVTAASVLTPGTSNPSGTIQNLPLQNGYEGGVTGTVVVVGGVLMSVTLNGASGAGYHAGDVLLPFGSGPGSCSIHVDSVGTGSDGTWGRTVFETRLFGFNQKNLFDPRTGNFWVHVESCELHVFRPSTGYTMEISPMEPPYSPSNNLSADGEIFGVTASWIYFVSALHDTSFVLMIRPSTIQAADRTADALQVTYTYGYPTGDSYYIRHCVGPDGNLYAYGASVTGTRAYKLYNVVAAVGYTEITPWGPATGPNSNCTNWTRNNSNTTWSKHHIFQLPASGNLVMISKLFPHDSNGAGGPNDLDNLRIDCTYYNIAGTTFDYHEGIVTGYMSAAWVPTTAGAAVWGVLNYREIDNYLDASDFVYPGHDYTKRWFVFEVESMSGGSPIDQITTMMFVQYHFVYGQAPVVLQVFPETLWDANPAYAAYAATVGQSQIIAASLPTRFGIGHTAEYTDAFQDDNGIFDTQTNSFILSGDQPQFCLFNPAFSDREAQAQQRWTTFDAGASSPFMRVFLTPSSGGGYTQGYIY